MYIESISILAIALGLFFGLNGYGMYHANEIGFIVSLYCGLFYDAYSSNFFLYLYIRLFIYLFNFSISLSILDMIRLGL